ncbi:MAG: hypothetical protein ACI976_002605 [Aureispira sp.]|jgi:hypothetical protein
MKIASFLLLLISLSFFACDSAEKTLLIDEDGRENFQAFRAKFYADSLFQVQRIEFPLLGNNPDGSAEPYLWEIENWKFKKAVDTKSDNIKMIPFYDMGDVVRERIIIQDAFMIQNMFSLINNKWYLTEYSGMKDLAFFSAKKEQPEVLPEIVLDSLVNDSLN